MQKNFCFRFTGAKQVRGSSEGLGAAPTFLSSVSGKVASSTCPTVGAFLMSGVHLLS